MPRDKFDATYPHRGSTHKAPHKFIKYLIRTFLSISTYESPSDTHNDGRPCLSIYLHISNVSLLLFTNLSAKDRKERPHRHLSHASWEIINRRMLTSSFLSHPVDYCNRYGASSSIASQPSELSRSRSTHALKSRESSPDRSGAG